MPKAMTNFLCNQVKEKHYYVLQLLIKNERREQRARKERSFPLIQASRVTFTHEMTIDLKSE